MNGSEPVRPSTYRRFLDRFAPYGLSPEANVAAYGLVENTLAVSSYGRRALAVDRRSLQKRRVEIVRDDAPAARRLELMSCGRHLDGVHVRIVDPETGAAVDGDKIGEVWVAGPSKCQGYWNRPELSDQVFRNSIGNDPDDEHSYLRTGDLGFLEGGEIFVCGRLKDVIILRGRNYYAEDLERAVELVSDRVRAGCVVAVRGQEDEDGLVVVVGVKRSDDLPDPGEVTRALRSHEYNGRHTIVFVRHQVIARTTSGKLARSRTREEWLDGTIAAIETHVNGSDGEAIDDEREFGLMSRYEQILNSYSLSGGEVQTLSEVGCICVCQAPSRSAPSVAGSCAQPADVLLQRQGCRASLRDGLRPPLTPEPLHARSGSVRGRQVPAPASRAAHSYVRRWCRGCSGSSLIGEHDAPQVCGDAPLEAAQRLASGLALIDLATEVGMPFGVRHPDLGDGDEVQGGVELAVPGTGQPVAGMFRAGDLDRSGAGVAGVVRPGREPGRRAGTTEHPSGQHRADAVHLAQSTARGRHDLPDALLAVLQAGIDPTQLRDHFAGEVLAGAFHGPGRADRAEQGSSLVGGQLGRRPAGEQVTQQRVQLVDQPGSLRGEVDSPLVQQRQDRCGVLLRDDRRRVAVQRGDAGRRRGVDHVVLPPPAAGELPHPGRRGRRHVLEALAADQQPLRQVPSQAAGVLYRPRPFRPLPRPGQQPPVVRQRRLDRELPELPLSGLLDDGSGVLPLVRIDPDDHHGSRPFVVPTGGRRGRQADLRLAHPRLC